MSGAPNRKELSERLEFLSRLIASLSAEKRHIERQLTYGQGADDVTLGQEFFWNSVFPILKEAGASGLTNGSIRSALSQERLVVNPSRFRIFLSRQGKRGVIELVKQISGDGRWRLTPKAFELVSTRNYLLLGN